MGAETELTALAQELLEMDAETFEITDYLDAQDGELGLVLYTSSTTSGSFCSSCSGVS